MFRFVIDTDTVVRAFRSPHGGSAKLLTMLADRRFIAPVTDALFLQWLDVLGRPEHVAVHRLSQDRLEEVFAILAELVTPVTVRFRWRPQLRDPGDELVLEAAINGAASGIVTANTRDFLPAALTFGVELLTVAEAIKRIDQ